MTRGHKASEIAAQSRRGPCVTGRPTLYGAPRDAEIVRQAGIPVLPIESGPDTAEKVPAHLNTVVEIELLIDKRVILAQPGPGARI